MSEKNLTDVFTKWRSRFLRQALRMLPSEEDAEDVLQDAFLKLWPLANRIKSEEEATALTSTTVRNLSIDRYRSNQRMKPAEHLELAESLVEDDAGTDERMQLVEDIMERVLTPVQRSIFRMREFEQLSYEEVAKKMNMQQPAVRMQLSRARKAIREAYRLSR